MSTGNYSYIGRGPVLLGLVGQAIRDIGNSSELKIGIEEETIDLENYDNAAGGVADSATWIKKVKVSFTIHNISPANLAMAYLGSASSVASGNVVGESHKAWKDSFVPLNHINPTSVVVNVGGSPKTLNTDYVVNSMGLYIPANSSIADEADITVDYAHGAEEVVEALTGTVKDYTIIFQGMNTSKQGRTRIVRLHRVKLSPASESALKSKEFAGMALTGVLLPDTSQPVGKSQYFREIIETAA
ncbi:MAG: hypothetical protein HQL07_13005 [Nitrospirae bacterium]|nr:hypothetical protein [Magnetococcales bacterium]